MKKSGFSLGAVLFIYIVAFGYVGFYSAKCADDYFGGHFLLSLMVVCASLVVGFFLHIIIHEFGHLVFGTLTGHRFKSFRIFNLMWQRDSDGKIRLYRYKLAGTGGQCLLQPPPLKDGDMPYVLYNLGGVMFNFLLAVLGMLASVVWSQIAVVAVFGRMLFVLGMMMGLENLLPLPGIANDGGNLLALTKSKEARQSLWVQMMGIVKLSEGTRIKDFPDEWFRMPNDEQLQNRMEAVMAVYVCDRLIDQHQFAQAQETIDSLLERDTALISVHLNLLRGDALFCELVGDGNAKKIEAYVTNGLTAFWKTMSTSPEVLKVRYAYEKLYQKNEQEAANVLAAFEKVADTYPYPCQIAADRELLAMVDEKASAETNDNQTAH